MAARKNVVERQDGGVGHPPTGAAPCKIKQHNH